MNARDELAKLLFVTDNHDAKDPDHEWEMTTRHNPNFSEAYFVMADAILAAGYRKPLTIDNEKLVIDDGLLLLDVGSCTCSPYGASHEPHCGVEYIDDLTKPLERAGYSKPRQVSTVEELDALPDAVLILTEQGGYWESVKRMDGLNWWKEPGSTKVVRSEDLTLPATVLHEPGQP